MMSSCDQIQTLQERKMARDKKVNPPEEKLNSFYSGPRELGKKMYANCWKKPEIFLIEPRLLHCFNQSHPLYALK